MVTVSVLTMSTSRRARSPRRPVPYHHGDLRRALIDAALALVRERGLDGFTLREAARRVGVSQTAPYRHFETKEALLAAVAEEGYRSLLGVLRGLPEAARADPRQRLRALGLAAFSFYVSEPARFRVMVGRPASEKERYPALAAAWDEVNALLLEGLVAAQQAGVIREGDPLELGLAIASLTHGLAAFVIDGHLGRHPDAAAVEELFHRANAVLFRGLHPSGREDPTPPATRPSSGTPRPSRPGPSSASARRG
jgi:AcrR family transcriptional regulator